MLDGVSLMMKCRVVFLSILWPSLHASWMAYLALYSSKAATDIVRDSVGVGLKLGAGQSYAGEEGGAGVKGYASSVISMGRSVGLYRLF
jgi:hypothetical protein